MGDCAGLLSEITFDVAVDLTTATVRALTCSASIGNAEISNEAANLHRGHWQCGGVAACRACADSEDEAHRTSARRAAAGARTLRFSARTGRARLHARAKFRSGTANGRGKSRPPPGA